MIDDSMIKRLVNQSGAVIDTVYGNAAFTPDTLRSFAQACYAVGQSDAQPNHTPVDPEEVYSPNTIILKE